MAATETAAVIPPKGRPGPRTRHARALHALAVGESFTAAYLDRSTVTALATYWGRRLGRVFVSRRDRDDLRRLRIYRLS